MRFQGKSAFITGGASGIGRQTASMLLAEGARVTVFDRNPIQLDDQSDRFLSITGDASEAGSLTRALERAQDRFGRITDRCTK